MAKAPISAKKDKRGSMAKKRARVLELRESGKTFQQIADAMALEFQRTYTRQTIHELYMSALKGIVAPSVEAYRETIIARNERIYSELADLAAGETVQDKDRIAALKACLSAQDQLIRVLGLSAPVKQDLNVTSNDKGEQVKAKLLEIVGKMKDAPK